MSGRGRVQGVVVGVHLIVPPPVPRVTVPPAPEVSSRPVPFASVPGRKSEPSSDDARRRARPSSSRTRPRSAMTASRFATVLPMRLFGSLSSNLSASSATLKEFSKTESSLRARTSEQA